MQQQNYSIDLQHIYSATSPTMAYVLFLEMAVIYKKETKKAQGRKKLTASLVV